MYNFRVLFFLVLIVTTPFAAAQRLPERELIYRMPDIIELQPRSDSQLILPNLTVRMLEGGVELMGRNLISVGQNLAHDIRLTVDLDSFTYSAATDSGPAAADSVGGELVNELDLEIARNLHDKKTVGGINTRQADCGRTWNAYLWVKLTTEDIVHIPLAATEQTAYWATNVCATTLSSVSRDWWAANPTSLNTVWFVEVQNTWQVPLMIPLTYEAWAGVYGLYRNDNFMFPNWSTYTEHEIEMRLHRLDYWEYEYTWTHWGELSGLLNVLISHRSNVW